MVVQLYGVLSLMEFFWSLCFKSLLFPVRFIPAMYNIDPGLGPPYLYFSSFGIYKITWFCFQSLSIEMATIEERRARISALITKYGIKEPERGDFASDPDTEWRFGGPPEYSQVNLSFLTGKTQNHKAGTGHRSCASIFSYVPKTITCIVFRYIRQIQSI
jgi:hypothetical protein